MNAPKDIAELKRFLKTLPKLADKDRDKRVKKAKNDFRFFVNTYFSHHIVLPERSLFRKFVYSDLPKMTETKISKLIFTAYRGSAKTTLITRFFSIWKALRGDSRYIVIISNTIDVAENSIEFIQTELEENINLAADFEILKGDTWQQSEFTFKAANVHCKFKAFGSGKKIRGENFLGSRPDLVILDDIENDENVQTKAQRDKLYRWFTKAILKLPDRKKIWTLIVVGTLLHYDAVLKRISKRKDFKSFSFPAVLKFPDNMELWQRLYDEPDREKAYKIYLKNKTLYRKGLVLDDSDINAFELLMEYFEDKESFYSEYQNDPVSDEGAPLAEHFYYESLPSDLVFTMAVDPALGKKGGDLSGIAVIGSSRSEKRFYTVFAKGYKLKPGMLIKKIIEIFLIYRPKYLVFETIAFQEFLKDKLKETALDSNIYLPIVAVKHRIPKEVRISSLSPYVSDSTLMFNKNDHQLIEEMLTFPKGVHDDVLDAVEMAFRKAVSGTFDYKAYKKAINAKKNEIKKNDWA